MYLLQVQEDSDSFNLVEHVGRNIPPYAILSHTWGSGSEEVTFKDIIEGTGKNKAGYRKLHFCGKQAAKDGLQHFWVDTCAIDKRNNTELAEAINSMFKWYRKADKCYVYLADFFVGPGGSLRSDPHFQKTWRKAFQESRWFKRGWTLQELLAPASVGFFSAEGIHFGDKLELLQEIHEATAIPIPVLHGSPLSQFSIEERMSWAKGRSTTREEDAAYSLLGIFDIHMPLLYGEGREKAFIRLRKKIEASSKFAAGQSNAADIRTVSAHTSTVFHESQLSSRSLGDDGLRAPMSSLSCKPSCVVYNNEIYCFHQDAASHGELWYNVFDKSNWKWDVRAPASQMSSAPAAVVYNNKIYCFYQGYGKNSQLWYNTFDGTNWAGEVQVPDSYLSISPSAVVYHNKIYCFHQGSYKCGQLWYNVFDGSNWHRDTLVLDGMSSAPSAVVYKDKIYCFYKKFGKKGQLWYSTFDETDWTGDVHFSNIGMSSGPCAVVYNEKIYCFHQGRRSDSQLWYYVFDGTAWTCDVQILSVGMSKGLSAVVYDNRIYYFYQGSQKNHELWYNVFKESSHS